MKKKKICTENCPLPVCDLPDLLTPKQMRIAMTQLDLSYKQMTDALHMGRSAVSNFMLYPDKCREKNRWISDYLKSKLLESMKASNHA